MFKKACVLAALAAVSLGAVVITASAEARTVSRDFYAYGDSQTDPRYPTTDEFGNKEIHYGVDGTCMGWQCDF